MTFRDLPIEILHKVLEECHAQSSVFDLDAGLDYSVGEGGFAWSRSIEGSDFWTRVLFQGGQDDPVVNCEEFYKTYPDRHVNLDNTRITFRTEDIEKINVKQYNRTLSDNKKYVLKITIEKHE